MNRGFGPALHVAGYADSDAGGVVILRADTLEIQRTPADWFAVAAALVEQSCPHLRSRRVAVADDRGILALSFANVARQPESERRVDRYVRGRRQTSTEVVEEVVA
ncbi:MAG TPA: hypothetical protein VHX66_00310 [Solirubrobacteraceae bacterium]|nr:hypothetical protein [Solirubrobacteraceae bacterium]